MTIFMRKINTVIMKKQGKSFQINVWSADLDKVTLKSKLFT